MDGDPLLDALLEMADVVAVQRDISLPELCKALQSHAARSKFEHSLNSDPLQALFPTGTSGYLISSHGAGGLISRDALPAALLLTPLQHAQLVGTRPSEEVYRRAMQEGLDRLRALAVGETAPVPTLVVFSGIEIAPGILVKLPWGKIRRLDGPNSGSTSGFFLLTDIGLRCVIAEPGPNPQPPPGFFDDSIDASIQRVERMTMLTFLLGITAGKPAALPLGHRALMPLDAQGSSARGREQPSLFGTQAYVGPDEVAEVQRWGRVVKRHYTAHLDIAIRRLAISVTHRMDPADGLVDVMVALESMFAGKSKTELTFRVAAAMAWLLEPADVRARHAIRKEVAELYGVRSSIVHGQRVKNAENLPLLRNRAFSLGQDSLRALYGSHPDLLAKDNRSLDLILGELPVQADD